MSFLTKHMNLFTCHRHHFVMLVSDSGTVLPSTPSHLHFSTTQLAVLYLVLCLHVSFVSTRLNVITDGSMIGISCLHIFKLFSCAVIHYTSATVPKCCCVWLDKRGLHTCYGHWI